MLISVADAPTVWRLGTCNYFPKSRRRKAVEDD
jgi:hypothetical protein